MMPILAQTLMDHLLSAVIPEPGGQGPNIRVTGEGGNQPLAWQPLPCPNCQQALIFVANWKGRLLCQGRALGQESGGL